VAPSPAVLPLFVASVVVPPWLPPAARLAPPPPAAMTIALACVCAELLNTPENPPPPPPPAAPLPPPGWPPLAVPVPPSLAAVPATTHTWVVEPCCAGAIDVVVVTRAPAPPLIDGVLALPPAPAQASMRYSGTCAGMVIGPLDAGRTTTTVVPGVVVLSMPAAPGATQLGTAASAAGAARA
jgi:hypothetical protein